MKQSLNLTSCTFELAMQNCLINHRSLLSCLPLYTNLLSCIIICGNKVYHSFFRCIDLLEQVWVILGHCQEDFSLLIFVFWSISRTGLLRFFRILLHFIASRIPLKFSIFNYLPILLYCYLLQDVMEENMCLMPI